jgi:hypothetical protein
MESYEIAAKAIEGGFIRELLLGEEGFSFAPKFSPSDLPTDLAVVLPDGVYRYAEEKPKSGLKNRIDAALRTFTESALEVTTFALVVYFESDRRFKGKSHLGLDLDSLASILKAAIVRNRKDFEREQGFGGLGFPDGVAGNLRRLSNMTKGAAGPGFFPED